MERLPTIKQLVHLEALARHRHFAKAAESCGVTQSTLSASIHELEVTLGGPVADRAARQVTLTLLGERVAEEGARILAELSALTQQARTDSAPLAGALRLGVIPTISPFLLPRLLPGLRARYPKLKLYLREDQTGHLTAALERGELDALLLAFPCACHGDSAPIAKDPLLLVLSKNHPLAHKKRVTPEMLASEKLLTLQDGHCLRDQSLAACGLKLSGEERYAATSIHTLVQMVDNGLGLTLLPKMAVDAGLLKGTALVARPLASPSAFREIVLLWKDGNSRQSEFELMAKECRRLFRASPLTAG